MDPITRELILTLRVRKATMKPLEDATKLARERDRLERVTGLKEARAMQVRERAERAEHRRRLRELQELKARRAEVFGMAGRAGRAGVGTAMVGGAIGLAAGVGFTKSFIDQARGAQNEFLAMTTLINSADSMIGGPLANVNAAFKESTSLLDQLREAAAATPGTFDDINTAFRDVVIPARRAGAEYKEIIKLASDMSTMSKVLGFDPNVVGQDVRSLLRGDSADILTPQLAVMREEVAKMARAGMGSQALAKIQGALAINPLIMARYSETFDAQWATLTDEWRSFAREAGKPILGWLTSELKEALKYLRENKEQVKQWAQALGEGVVDAMKEIKAALAWMWSNREQIIEWAKWLAGATGLAAVASAVGSIVSGLKAVVALGPGIAGSLSAAFGPLTAVAAIVSLPPVQKFIRGLVYSDEERAWNEGLIDYGKKSMSGRTAVRLGEIEDFLRSGSRDYDLALPMYEELRKLAGLGGSGNNVSWAQELLRTNKPALEDFAKAAKEAAEAARGFRADLDAVAVMNFRMPNGRAAWGEGQQWLLEKGLDILGGVRENAYARITANNDFRGSRFTINQKLETDNPAMMARTTLLAGFEAVARQPIRARSRPGSVGLANGD